MISSTYVGTDNELDYARAHDARMTRDACDACDARDAWACASTRSAFRGLRAIAEISSEGMGPMSPETLGFLVVHTSGSGVSMRDRWGFTEATMPCMPNPSPLYHTHRACVRVVRLRVRRACAHHARACVCACARARLRVGARAGTCGCTGAWVPCRQTTPL